MLLKIIMKVSNHGTLPIVFIVRHLSDLIHQIAYKFIFKFRRLHKNMRLYMSGLNAINSIIHTSFHSSFAFAYCSYTAFLSF